jgi:hypothetical protein
MKAAFAIAVLLVLLPVIVLAQPGCPTDGSPPASDSQGRVPLCNPVELDSFSSTDVVAFASKIILIVAGFSTLLPIIAVTYAGFSMVISQGEQEAITKAKTSLTWAVMGFVISILSYVIIIGTIHLLGANNLPDDPTAVPGETIVSPLEIEDLGGGSDFINFVYGMLKRFLEFVGIIAMLFLILSGFRYITSAGNEEQAKTAKTSLTWTVIGIVVILLSYVIIRSAASLFGVQ